MDLTLYITFILASVALIIVPGLNVLVIISTSVSHGAKRGLQTVFGTTSAMVVQLLIAAMGTTWLVESLSSGFRWLRWIGVGYLLFLGISHFQKMLSIAEEKETTITTSSTFSRGFLVSLTNPKTILFFGAFLPQFVVDAGSYFQQIVLLSATFLLLATLLDSLYAVLAGRVKNCLQGHDSQTLQHGVSGALFIGASAWLAFARKG